MSEGKSGSTFRIKLLKRITKKGAKLSFLKVTTIPGWVCPQHKLVLCKKFNNFD